MIAWNYEQGKTTIDCQMSWYQDESEVTTSMSMLPLSPQGEAHSASDDGRHSQIEHETAHIRKKSSQDCKEHLNTSGLTVYHGLPMSIQ